MANSFFAKLNFDGKAHQGYLCLDEASALSGNTSGFAALMKPGGPPAAMAGTCWTGVDVTGCSGPESWL